MPDLAHQHYVVLYKYNYQRRCLRSTYRSPVRGEERLVVRLVHLTGGHGGCHHRVGARVGLLLRHRGYPGQVHVGPGALHRRALRVEQGVGHVRLLVQIRRRRRRRRRPRFDVLLRLRLRLRLRRRMRVRLMRRLLLLGIENKKCTCQ